MAEVQKKFLTKILPSDVGGLEDVVRFVLGNGLEVQCCLDDLHDSIKGQLMLHGLSQKVGDSASGFSKARDFSGAFGAMQGVVDNLLAGVWSSRSNGGAADLVAAIAELRSISVEDAQAAFDKMTEEQVKAVASHPKVKEVVKRIQAERAREAAEGAEELVIPGLD